MSQFPVSNPGVGNPLTITPRMTFAQDTYPGDFFPGGSEIDGNNTRDPDNSPATLCRPGLLLAKATVAGANTSVVGDYCASVIGEVLANVGGGQTTLTLTSAQATELIRRQGATGTFNITGAPTSTGVVRTKIGTYSAVVVGTGVVTITALATGAVSAVNQINSIPMVDNTGVGTYTITVEGITTAAITYSATAATNVTNINNALNAALGTSAIVASGASLAALILTSSGTGYAGRPVGAITVTILVNAGGTTFTINGVGTVGVASTCLVTTAGVTAVAADEGEFFAGSLIGPTDGSQVIATFISGDLYPVQVTDTSGVSMLTPFRYIPNTTKPVLTANLIGYPGKSTYPALCSYIKQQLHTVSPALSFDDDY